MSKPLPQFPRYILGNREFTSMLTRAHHMLERVTEAANAAEQSPKAWTAAKGAKLNSAQAALRGRFKQLRDLVIDLHRTINDVLSHDQAIKQTQGKDIQPIHNYNNSVADLLRDFGDLIKAINDPALKLSKDLFTTLFHGLDLRKNKAVIERILGQICSQFNRAIDNQGLPLGWSVPGLVESKEQRQQGEYLATWKKFLRTQTS